MRIIVIDGQGGGIGRSLVEQLKKQCPQHEVLGVGINAIATAAMVKACLLYTSSIIYIVVRIFLAPASMPAGAAEGERLKSDYVLMLLQCILGVAVLMLPSILAKRFRLEIPSMMLILFVLFLYCAVYLGEVQDFYYKVSNWDTILHCFSGGMLGTLGFSVIALFNNSDRIPVNLSPIFVAFFAFCFAMRCV